MLFFTINIHLLSMSLSDVKMVVITNETPTIFNSFLGTYEERGMVAWQSSMGVQTNKDVLADAAKIERQTLRLKKLRETIYIVPFAKQILKKCPYLGYLPFMPRQSVNGY